jgi:hypothetical protein
MIYYDTYYIIFVSDACIPTLCKHQSLYQLLWNMENSNQLPQQLKHMRIKFYIYVIPEYRVPWLDIYKYPLPDTCTRWGK